VIFSSLLALGEPLLLYADACGAAPVEPMRHPCWLSQGVCDFWGRRWNVTVHRFLRSAALCSPGRSPACGSLPST
jgi:hypothetical protein